MPLVRRLARFLLNALTVLSLLLCLAIAGLWARSYWRGDNVRWSKWVGRDDETVIVYLGSGAGLSGMWPPMKGRPEP